MKNTGKLGYAQYTEKFSKYIVILAVFLLPVRVIALTLPEYTDPALNTIPKVILAIIETALLVALPIAGVAIIWAGFLFVFSRGDPAKVTKAKSVITWTVVGLIVIVAAWAIAEAVVDIILGP